MESDEKRAAEALEGRLNSLNIEDDANQKEEKAKMKEENTTGWKSKASVEDLKAKFQDLTRRAKQEAHDGDLEESLKLYRKAYKIHKSEKVAKRIEKLEIMLEELDDENSDEDEEGYVKVASGFKVPERVYNKLYPYQKEGIAWFWNLYQARKGGILGDDMGLGKTIQVISFLAGMFGSGHIKTVLIIMPVSLLTNWEKEFKKWAPEIRVRNFHGSSVKQRLDNLAKIQCRDGVCLTTYGLANTCHAQFSEDRYGKTFTWDYIILDEGHKIKNTANKTTIAIRAIPANNHFILTGTPIQNNLREMWALFDFVCQGQLLGTSRSFKQEYENPIVRARERDATAYEKRMGQEMSVHLRELIAPHFLRRTKDILEQGKKTGTTDDDVSRDVVDGSSDKENEENNGVKKPKLTRKNDFIIWLYLSPTQLQIYEDFIKLDRVKEILMTTKSPLAELNVLKRICDHPRLLSTMACKQLGLNEEVDDEEDLDVKYEWCAPPVEQLVQESGKLVFLLQLLQQLKSEGHRTLVFSQSRKMLDIMQKVLKDKNFKVIRIDGTITSIVERESRINTFQTDPSYSVFLLTTQVGGVGLTLTAADRVVIFDPSWNPATDAQAVDRAYRIGQKNTVVIYRLITCGSLEEKIYRKQVFKQAITKQTTGSSNNPFRYFTRHELRDLFVLDNHRSSKTQIQLEKMHSAHRVTDTLLDEHVAFLYSTDIFGISDHDLLFTKEAVATEEELSAACEMGDVIQAKVRRAADIMRAESSQASAGRVKFPPVENRKKSQTKIQDHAVEIFIPSREDSRRFKPGKKVSKSPPPSDVIDLTVLDAKMDDDALEQQFSAITLDEESSGRGGDNVVEISPNVYFQEAQVEKNKDGNGVIEREGTSSFENHHEELLSRSMTEKSKEPQDETLETGGHSGNIEQSDSYSDAEILRQSLVGSAHDDFTEFPRQTMDSDKGFPEERSFEVSENRETSRHVVENDSENETSEELQCQEIQGNDSISEKNHETAGEDLFQRSFSPDLLVVGEEKVDKSLVSQQISGSVEILEDSNEEEMMQVVEVPENHSDSETDEEISRKRLERQVIDDDDSSEDERAISNRHKPSRRILDSDDEAESQENISNSEKNEDKDNEMVIQERHASLEVVEIDSDSENEDNRGSLGTHASDGSSEVENVSENPNVSENVTESESEDDEVFSTPRSSTSSFKSPENQRESEKNRTLEFLDSGIRDHSSSPANETVDDENESPSKLSRKDSEDDEISDTESHDESRDKTSENPKQTPSRSNAAVSNFENEHSSEKDKDSMREENSENDDNLEEKHSEKDGHSEKDEHYEEDEHSEKSEDSEKDEHSEKCEDSEKDEHSEKSGDSEKDENSREDEDSEKDEDSGRGENSERDENSEKDEDSERGESSERDENYDKFEELPDSLRSNTTCCPKGIHVSELFEIRRCPCVMSSTEIEAYKMHINTARRNEKSGEARLAMKHFVEAFKLCDSDARLHTRIRSCYKLMKKSTSDV